MDILSYALSKKFTEDTAIGLGAVKGSPATVKSYNYDADGNTIITFEWTATDSTTRTSSVSVKRGIDGRGIVSAYFNEEGKLVIVVDGGETLDPITMPSASVEISKVPENAVTQKADGIYVKTVDLDGYVEKEDGKSLVLDTDITQINSNKEAIEVLNGDNTVDGSVDKKITTAIGGLTKLEKEISATVPTVEEAKDNVLYLVPSETSGVYEQWMLIGGEVVSLGSTEVDLTNYVEKVEGKGLSTNDYTDEDKALVGTIEDKVDKEDGKGLSTNDFTDDDKDAVDSIENKVDRYATMPSPSAELSGVIAQYVGSGDMYQNGYFYICVQNDAGTWVWREKDVQKPADSSFKGTHDEWNDLSDEQKAQYETVIFTDDYDKPNMKFPDYAHPFTVSSSPWTAPCDCWVTFQRVSRGTPDKNPLLINGYAVACADYDGSEGLNGIKVISFYGFIKEGDILTGSAITDKVSCGIFPLA